MNKRKLSKYQADRARMLWMRDFETAVIRKSPAYAGRIDWDTASFLYRQNVTPADAAERYAITYASQTFYQH